jgi:hypothetical protein
LDDNLTSDLGADSLDIDKFWAKIQYYFNHTATDDVADSLKTLQDTADWLAKELITPVAPEQVSYVVTKRYIKLTPDGKGIDERVVDITIETVAPLPPKFYDALGILLSEYAKPITT